MLVFPSIREFGGGNIFEALAMGVVPIVVAFGGPGDIVNPDVGYRVPLTNPDDVVAQMQRALSELDGDPDRLQQMSGAGMRYAPRTINVGRQGAGSHPYPDVGGRHGPEARHAAPHRKAEPVVVGH